MGGGDNLVVFNYFIKRNILWWEKIYKGKTTAIIN
jgi:hypothetical protein